MSARTKNNVVTVSRRRAGKSNGSKIAESLKKETGVKSPHSNWDEKAALVEAISKDRWIHYDRGDEYLDDFQVVRTTRNQARTPCRILYGESNNGKSMLLKKFYEDCQAGNHGKSAMPVLLTEMDYSGSMKEYLNGIMDLMHVETPRPKNLPDLARAAVAQMASINVEVLLIDEFHHVLQVKTSEQQKFLNFLKSELGEKHNIAVIAAGTMMALNVIYSDEQIKTRFLDRELPRWEYDDDYIALLVGLAEVSRTPGMREFLLDEKNSSYLLQVSKGTIGRTRNIVINMAIELIKNDERTLDSDLMQEVVNSQKEVSMG